MLLSEICVFPSLHFAFFCLALILRQAVPHVVAEMVTRSCESHPVIFTTQSERLLTFPYGSPKNPGMTWDGPAWVA